MQNKSIATSTLWQIASQVTMAALSIVTVKFVAIGLSKELAGEYNTAYGYLQIFGILADFGLYAVAVREVSRAPDATASMRGNSSDRGHVLGALLLLRFAILCVSLGAALLFAWAVPQWKGTPLPMGITIAAFVPFFTLLAGMLRTIFQVTYKMHHVFIAEVTQRVVTVTLTGLIIVAGVRQSTDERVLYLMLAIGGLGSLVLLCLSIVPAMRLIRIRPAWDSALLTSTLLLAMPYGLAFLCTTLYRQFDVTLIGLLRPDHEIQNAYYGFVQRAMDMAYLLPTFLLNSTLPLLSAREAKGEDTQDLTGMVLLGVLFIGMTAFLFASLWARPLMQMLTTDSYLAIPGQPGSDTAMRILSVSMFMNGIIVFCFYSLLTKNAWRPLVRCLALGAVFSLGMNVWLIPTHGFVGASVTSAITHTILVAMLLPLTYRHLPFRIRQKGFIQLLLFSAGLFGFLFTAAPFLTGPLVTALALAAGTVWMAGIGWGVGLRKL